MKINSLFLTKEKVKDRTLIRTIFIFLFLLTSFSTLSNMRKFVGADSFDLNLVGFNREAKANIIKGPYLQNVTQDSIVVMWETDAPTPSLLEYVCGSVLIQVNSTPNPVCIHEVTITGLTSATYYQYRVSFDGHKNFWTTWAKFLTAPEAEEPFRLAVYGDSRTNVSDHTKVVESIIKNSSDIVLSVGDLVSHGKNYKEWERQFFTPASPLMKNTPLFPVLGNHEYNGTGSMWYYDFFSLPGNEQWYAFTYGCVRFIGMDTKVNFLPGSEQYNWLIGELKSSEYNEADWKIVFFHYPPYTSGLGHNGNLNVQTYLVPLFEQYGIDIVFNGHTHNYERSYKDGSYYIVTGGGGASPSGFKEDPLSVNPYSQIRVVALHYCILDITPQSLTFSARYIDGTQFDTFVLNAFLNY